MLELESDLKEEVWDSYLANLFVVHLSCWGFILANPEPFVPLTSIKDRRENIILHQAMTEGFIPLAQLFQVQPKKCNWSRNLDTITINLRYLLDNEINWTIVDNFIPGITKLDAGVIYLPKSTRNPGWDLCICFLDGSELSALFVQSKDMQDGNDLAITPLEIGKSICHTTEQIENIRKNNVNLQFHNCYYLLFSRKRAPGFSHWKQSVQNKLQKN